MNQPLSEVPYWEQLPTEILQYIIAKKEEEYHAMNAAAMPEPESEFDWHEDPETMEMLGGLK